jgi:hypothetical protein
MLIPPAMYIYAAQEALGQQSAELISKRTAELEAADPRANSKENGTYFKIAYQLGLETMIAMLRSRLVAMGLRVWDKTKRKWVPLDPESLL